MNFALTLISSGQSIKAIDTSLYCTAICRFWLYEVPFMETLPWERDWRVLPLYVTLTKSVLFTLNDATLSRLDYGSWSNGTFPCHFCFHFQHAGCCKNLKQLDHMISRFLWRTWGEQNIQHAPPHPKNHSFRLPSIVSVDDTISEIAIQKFHVHNAWRLTCFSVLKHDTWWFILYWQWDSIPYMAQYRHW